MFPIIAPGSRVVAFGARSFGDAQPKYLNSTESLVFQKRRTFYGLDRAHEAIRNERHAVVVEGYTDLIRLHLSGVVLLAPHLSDDNAEELVAEAVGKSKAEIEVLLAHRAPRPDVPERLERVAEQVTLVAPGPVRPTGEQVAPGPVRPVGEQVAPGPPGQAEDTARVAPLAPERFALQVTIGEATHRKLLRAQALLRHQVPSGDLAEVLDRALDALLDRVEGRKLGKTRAPRAGKPSRAKRYVPRAVRREVALRDGLRCSFVAEDGRRCEETGFLELDHVVPVSRGGEASAEGVRVLCRSHNQYEAERILGRETVLAGKARALERDLIAGLRRLGVTASDARLAVAASRGPGTVEQRMRAALGALRNLYAGRDAGPRPSRNEAHVTEVTR
jgi:5-methylcytosine-specific restriction endonuclease McrA